MANIKQNEVDALSNSFFQILFSFLSAFLSPRISHGYTCNRGCHSTCHGLTIRLVQTDWLASPQTQVEHLHKNRKTHGEVNVSFWDMLVQSLDDQGKPDQEQET